MNAMGMGQGGMMGGMGAMGGTISQYWKKHIADSFWLRIGVWILACLAILFQSLVILNCVPGAQGSSSGTSKQYLLEFHTANFTSGATTRLRVGYTAMCCSLSEQSEHCAITIGKSNTDSIRYLSTGQNDAQTFSQLVPDQRLNEVLFKVAVDLQNDVFVVLPAIPGAFLAAGVILAGVYGILNRPWVGPASSWRQSQRNRRLDIMRIAMIALIGLSIIFSFSVAVANSQLFAAMKKVTAHNQEAPDVWTVQQGTTALALHWLAVIATIGFYIGLVRTHIAISSVRVKVTPDDTAGTTGGHEFASVGGSIEKASLLKDAEPMAINPAGLAPQGPQGGQPAGSAGAGGAMGGPMGMAGRGGMAGGMAGGMRGGMMGRGGPMMRGRGGPMGMAGRGRGM